jgi:hypothetical protein
MCQAGFLIDAAALARGRADGETGRFRLTEEELLKQPAIALAYLVGFHRARLLSRRGGIYAA